MDATTLEEKLDAARKDLDEWKGFDETIGQVKRDDTDFEPCFSCQLMGISKKDGLASCRSKKYGKCAFYNCLDRPSYLEWLEHHRQFHPNDKVLFVHDTCHECKRLRDKEVGFMEDAISELDRKLKQIERRTERMNSLADIAKEMNVKR